VKVFFGDDAQERDQLGEKITTGWPRIPGVEIVYKT